ncbi:hypothetical protein TcasGA2_TC034621 [Tribolium castaneum]|uniref:Uncharacterized protein n=1 Tax=Tribolium castaneum TaxID=7070 RepID=A0A139WKU8_TRICA|nr:hypothetical protein TcasGA2_TC034621 [Tribolium castaneum]
MELESANVESLELFNIVLGILLFLFIVLIKDHRLDGFVLMWLCVD